MKGVADRAGGAIGGHVGFAMQASFVNFNCDFLFPPQIRFFLGFLISFWPSWPKPWELGG